MSANANVHTFEDFNVTENGMQTKLHSLPFLPLLVLAMLVNILPSRPRNGAPLGLSVMGHEPVRAFTKLVQLREIPPSNPDEWVEITNVDDTTSWLKLSSLPSSRMEKAVATAACPLLGLLSAILGLVMSRRSVKVTSNGAWLAYTLVISLVAAFYFLRNPIRTGGDEYDIAMNLGIAKAFVEIPIALGYLACLILSLRELPAWKTRLTWLGASLPGSIATGLPMALLDSLIIAQVDAGNAWFQPAIGFDCQCS